MGKFLEKFVLSVFLFSVSIGPEAYMAAGRNFFFVDSYIEHIDTPSYGHKTTMDILDKFNSYGSGNAVNFHKKSPTSRAIYITEAQEIPGKESVIGQALPLWDRCDIVIEKGLDSTTYYHVLLHEYLHCMGYTHSRNEQDLMYPSITYVPESNIMQYAEEIAERNKWWTILKN